MATVRVRAEGGPVSVEHPEANNARVTLKPGQAYAHDDPIVVAYPWAFESDVEEASSTPGERRNVRARTA